MLWQTKEKKQGARVFVMAVEELHPLSLKCCDYQTLDL
jgi:hypothetical protein